MSAILMVRTGAVLFILWGLLHIIGGGMILAALASSTEQGFAVYQNAAGPYPDLAGKVLGYLAYTFVWIGVLVAAIGGTLNWRNSELGLALNTALVGLTDLGLVVFLVLPGHVSWAEASIGLVLFVAAAILGGIACNAPKPSAA